MIIYGTYLQLSWNKSLGGNNILVQVSTAWLWTGIRDLDWNCFPRLARVDEQFILLTSVIIYEGLVRRKSHKFSDFSKDELLVKLDKQSLIEIWQQTSGSEEDKARAIVDYLDFYLNANQLSLVEGQSNYLAVINAMLATPVLGDKVDVALYGIVNAPESIVQQ